MTIIIVVLAANIVAVVGFVACARGSTATGNGLFAVGNLMLFTVDVLEHSPGWAAFNGSAAVLFAIAWWRGGGGGKARKAARELGAKSRARVQALVDQMGPSPVGAR